MKPRTVFGSRLPSKAAAGVWQKRRVLPRHWAAIVESPLSQQPEHSFLGQNEAAGKRWQHGKWQLEKAAEAMVAYWQGNCFSRWTQLIETNRAQGQSARRNTHILECGYANTLLTKSLHAQNLNNTPLFLSSHLHPTSHQASMITPDKWLRHSFPPPFFATTSIQASVISI